MDFQDNSTGTGPEEDVMVLATGNIAKVKELNALLKGKGLRVRSLEEVLGKTEIEETGVTLDENAVIKARFTHEMTGMPALADDTGLEVDVLDGQPGVRSARYAGSGSDDRLNRRKLLNELRHITDPALRIARFRTVLVYMDAEEVKHYEGVCNGRIINEERGKNGFGYDPVFVPDGYQHTFAEMDPDEKNRISHRGRALKKFLDDISHRWM